MTNPTATDPFATAATTGPVVRCLGNDRLVVFIPTRIEQQQVPPQYLNGRPAGTVQDVLVADVIAIDGAPIMYGGDPQKGIPDTEGPIMPGTPMREFRLYQTTLISQLRPHIGRGPVIGRLFMGVTKSNLPNWKIVDPREGDKAMALAPYQAYASGQFNAPAPAQPTYAPQSVSQAAPVAQPAPAAYVPQATAQPVPQAAPVAAPPPVPGVGMQGGMPMPAQPVQAAPVATVPQPAPDWTLGYAAPNGFSAEQWASFSMPQRAQLLGLNGVQAPAGA